MTPDELRALADSATPGPWTVDEDEPTRILDAKGYDHTYASSDADARLIAVVLELARLCADMGQLLSRVAAFEPWWSDPAVDDEAPLWEDAQAALAKLSDLNNGAEHPPGAERT